jgi:hypothetical protein
MESSVLANIYRTLTSAGRIPLMHSEEREIIISCRLRSASLVSGISWTQHKPENGQVMTGALTK